MFHSLRGNNIGGYWDDSQDEQIYTPEGPLAIAEALRVNAVLTELSVASNYLGPDGAKAFVDALRVNAVVTSLNISGNK